ncbi:MAG: M60 family metallopeptidase [Akkermansia sp.]|nr:M60 family metallopeptidase [Akkermansia sp.]
MKKSLLLLTLGLCAAFSPLAMADVPTGTDISGLNTAPDREAAYRHRIFRAYRPLSYIGERLHVGGYSRYENPTGIFFKAGETATFTVSGNIGGTLELIVHDFGECGQDSVHPLSAGENTITIPADGLTYVNYRADDPASAPAITVDIKGGAINGVFSRVDDNATWNKMLKEAKAATIDAVGERCQLAYNVTSLQEGCPESGAEVLANYDKIIEIEQKLLGWDQYGIHPGNHVLGRCIWQGFMHADGQGAAFIYTEVPNIANPDVMLKQSWGIAHEFGHVNQTRRGMLWTGVTEVTNNIFSALVNYRLYPQTLRLEHETGTTPDGHRMRGSRFDSYVNSAIVNRELWQFQAGPDDGSTPVTGEKCGDPFVICCPMWQLQLYVAEARGNQMFYPAIYEDVRNTDETEMTHGELRTLFFRRACDAAKLNLTEFFTETGMLAPMNRRVNDYSSTIVTVTPEMCADALAYATKYPKPDSSVIYYITGNNVGIYRDRLPLKPTPGFVPEFKGDICTIPAGVWQNAVAFEVYSGDKLIRISLLGSNHEDNVTTDVICPEGTTEIKAVQWDGKRATIWHK